MGFEEALLLQAVKCLDLLKCFIPTLVATVTLTMQCHHYKITLYLQPEKIFVNCNSDS